MIMIILIVAFIILLLVWGIATYNRLITERLKVETQWSQIDVVLKQRFDLIPNLVETVKGYLSAADTKDQMKASAELSGAMCHLMAVAEFYPELKANQNFLHLQQQLSVMEEKLANYRQFYNDMVLRYDRLLETVPTNLIAKMFHFKKEEFFKVEEAEKAKVTIKF